MERSQNPHLDIRDAGIWRIIRRKSDEPFFHWSWITQASHLVYTHLHLVRCVSTLTRQVIAIAPFHLALYFLARAYYSLASLIGLYSSQILLDSVCRFHNFSPPLQLTIVKITPIPKNKRFRPLWQLVTSKHMWRTSSSPWPLNLHIASVGPLWKASSMFHPGHPSFENLRT